MELLNKINAELKDNMRFRVLLVLCSIFLICVREPALLLHPRLWAEEGSIFYQFALHHSVFKIFTTAHVGYLTLFNSIVSILQAKLFSVENAAIISTYMGFLVQLVPVYIVGFTNHRFWDSPIKKMACTLVFIVVTAPEQWLNTTNSHFLFGLITFLIMLVPGNELSTFQKWFFRFLLLVCGLTGPASVFFTPAFLIKAYKEKNREKYIQLLILLVCTIIQAGVILYAIFYNNTYHRLTVFSFSTTKYHFIVDNFSLLPHTAFFTYQLFSFEIISLSGMLMFVFTSFFFFKTRKQEDTLVVFIGFVTVAIFSTLGSLSMEGGARYSYIPTCILMTIILSEVLEQRVLTNTAHYITTVLISVFLIINLIWYRPVITEWAYNPNYPKWKDEVAKWRKDSLYMPKAHPAY